VFSASSVSELLLETLWRLAAASDDELLLFVHFGPLADNLLRSTFLDHSAGLELSINAASNASGNAVSDAVDSYVRNHVDLVQLLDLIVLHNTRLG